MYQPPAFREDRPEVLQALMRAHPFATVVTSAGGPVTADHLPLTLETGGGGFGTLLGHVAAANPLVAAAAGGCDALVIFQGPQAYVTPSLYPSKAEHGKVVPTWNYAVVHARGRLRVIDDPDWLRSQVGALTDMQEAPRAHPWAVADAPEDFVARQLKGIRGVEIALASVEGKWKVSQNKAEHDRNGVARGMADTDPQMAALVAERLT